MQQVFWVNLKGILRDRVFHGILLIGVAYLFIPSLSVLSMRQVAELSMTLSLSLLTFVLLLLSVFLGGTSLWKDVDRRYTFSTVSLPMSRSHYLIGKFVAVAVFLCLVTLVLGALVLGAVYVASSLHPPQRPIAWNHLYLAVAFHCLKYILLVAFAFMFSAVSTSFFLPIFGTLATFFIGTASQEVYDFLQTPAAQALPAYLRKLAGGLYYVVPNFSAFNLNVNAIYAIAPSWSGLGLTLVYFMVYLGVLLTAGCLMFRRRELK